MFKFLILFFFIVLNTSFANSSLKLNNNIKSNIDILATQLELYSQDDISSNKQKIANLLKIYYEKYDKIVAFEIKNNKNTLYSSFRNDDSMILFKDVPLEENFEKTNEYYEKEITHSITNENIILKVYFKNQITFSKQELEYLQNKKVLKVQNDSNLPPYNFIENGITKGYAVDYLELIANKLAIEIEYVRGNWNDFMNMLEANELDLMINILKSKQREERFLFSNKAFVTSPLAMLTRIEHKDVQTFKEMEGETMALVKGYHSYDRVKRDYPKINVLATPNTFEMMKAVSNEKADGAYGLKSVLDYNISKHLLTNLKTIRNIDDDEFGFYFAYNKENLILKSIIQKAEKLITKKEIQQLNEKWFKKTKETKIKSKNFLFTPEEIKYLNMKKFISLCIDPNSKPFEFITEDGNYKGIIASFIETMSKNSGVKFEILNNESWSSSLDAVKNKVCDILPFAIQTQSRNKYLNFTQEYFSFTNVIATKDSEIFVESLETIKNKKVAIIKDHATIELIKAKYPNINILEVKDTVEGLKKVSNAEAYAFVGLFPSIAHFLQKENIQNVRITGKTNIEFFARIGIRKDEIILQSILNKAINSVKEEEKEQILNKWITIIKEDGFNTKLLIQIVLSIFILSAIIIILIIYSSNKKLNKMNKELKKLSQTDKLTSIYNRFKLDSLLEKELSRKKRYNHDLSVILIDIDYFKKINDTYGHLSGDKILQEFAKIIRHNIRESDYFGRWGGEEFLLILPHTKEHEAYNLAQKLREIIQNYKFHQNIKVTASFGVSECKDFDGDKMLSYADKALYEAKEANRNCVKIYKR